MSKNLTRKGLALAAIAALGVSVFAGAPAQASTETAKITLVPSKGTSYTSIAGAVFNLKTEIDATIKTIDGKTPSKLSYLITNSSAKNLQADFVGSNGGGVNILSNAAASAADNVAPATAGTSYAGTDKSVVVTGTTGNTADATDHAGSNLLTLKTSEATADVTFTVQAFIDDNNDGQIGAFEYATPVRTVNFLQAANVTATTTITSAAIGASTIQANVVFGSDVNGANLNAGDVKIGFKNSGTALNLDLTGTGDTVTTDAVDTNWATGDDVSTRKVTAYVRSSDGSDTAGSIAAGTIVAQAYFLTTATKLGSSSAAAAPVNGTVTSVDSVDNVVIGGSASVLASNSAAKVKAGYTGAISITGTVVNNGGVAVKTAGLPVLVTLTKSVISTGNSFTAGGKTLTATSGPVSFQTTTDADGKVAYSLASALGTKGDAVIVTAKALTSSSTWNGAATNTITWEDAAAAKPVVTNLKGASAELKIARNGSYTLNYAVVDQFGQPWTAANYRLDITVSGGTAAFAYYPAVGADGKVSQTIVDNSTVAGTYVVAAQLKKLNTAGTWVNAQDRTATDVAVANVTVNANAIVSASVSATPLSTTAQATITKSLVTADLRVDGNSQTTTTIGYGSSATQNVHGTVKDANGVGVAGELVTLTGAGLGFVVDGKIFSVGSATVLTNGSGVYTVDIYSTTAGKASVVVTSGAATATAAIEFSGITAMAETNVLSLDVASLSQVGRAVTVSVKLVDKYGNAVDTAADAIAVSVTGVGSLSASKVETDSKGVATVQFLAGANDFGDAVITAKYTATDAAATVVTTSKTITVGVTDAQVDIVNNRVTAVSSFTKGRTVSFYVDGVKKWSKLSASDADVVLNYNLKKGTHTITVKISGGFVTTEKFIVK